MATSVERAGSSLVDLLYEDGHSACFFRFLMVIRKLSQRLSKDN